MNPKIKKILEDQGTHELYAANCYRAMSFWCACNDYAGYASFFESQAAEEQEHAEKFFKHILDRGALPVIGAIESPQSEYTGLIQIAEQALSLEEANTRGITDCYELSLAERDYASQSLLLWFISEQVEEEAWANSLVVKTERAQCAGSLFYLDRHLTKELGAD